jgi:hypothetical protein
VSLSAEGIAGRLGIAETFAGVTLLAVATSLPELVTSLGAVRIGSYDLAVGNLFGSNAGSTVPDRCPTFDQAGPDQLGGGITTMGRPDWLVRAWLTLPSISLAMPPRPRDPTTIMSAASRSATSRSVWAGSPSSSSAR